MDKRKRAIAAAAQKAARTRMTLLEKLSHLTTYAASFDHTKAAVKIRLAQAREAAEKGSAVDYEKLSSSILEKLEENYSVIEVARANMGLAAPTGPAGGQKGRKGALKRRRSASWLRGMWHGNGRVDEEISIEGRQEGGVRLNIGASGMERTS